MGPPPSWTPLLNLRLMAHYLSLSRGNLHIQTSTYSGIVTITSQPNLVSFTPSSIGPQQCVASMSCSNRKRTTSGRLSLNANIPNGALDKVEKRLSRSTSEVIDGVNNQGTTAAQPVTNEVKNKGHIVIPYTQGLCESIKKIHGRYGIQTHFKHGRTIKNLLVSPKDKDPMVNQNGAIYWYQCGDLGCDDKYIGETYRTSGERYKEHLKAPSAIHHHSSQTGCPTSHNDFQIIGREGHNVARNIKESIYIMVNNPP